MGSHISLAKALPAWIPSNRSTQESLMTPLQFRKLALALPEAMESEHMKHPDFRIRGKVFATLGPDGDWGMVKLTPVQQADRMKSHGEMFEPANGAWGERGYTHVILAKAEKDIVRCALVDAWTNVAPKRLAEDYEGEL